MIELARLLNASSEEKAQTTGVPVNVCLLGLSVCKIPLSYVVASRRLCSFGRCAHVQIQFHLQITKSIQLGTVSLPLVDVRGPCEGKNKKKYELLECTIA